MSIMSKIFTGAASAVIVTGVAGVLAGTSAKAATPSCGHDCINLFSQKFGHNFVVDAKGQGATDGTPAILFQGSNSDPAEDWSIVGYDPQNPTHVSDYYSNGVVGGAVNVHYGNDVAFEIEYTPWGNSTAECLGTATTPGKGTKVSLQPCGASAKTLWIVDAADVQTYAWRHYVPLINGAGTNFNDPYVLRYPGGNPNDRPRPQLVTWPLLKDSHGVVHDDEEWGVKFGTLK
jgi:hypothetical protein